jgi:predicted RNase H-like HicB family nuclease
MDFYTAILRKSSGYWVALCLENGIVGQSETQDDAIAKLKEAIDSVAECLESLPGVCQSPISIAEIDEFLTMELK